MAPVTICSDLEHKKVKSVTLSTFSPSICCEVMGPDAMISVFWILSFKPVFSSRGSLVSLSFLPLGWYHLHVWGDWYFSWQSWFQLDSSSPAFCMMYSACKLNKEGDNIQPWRTPFPIWNQSVVPCLVPVAASWPAHRFLRRQVSWSGIFPSL